MKYRLGSTIALTAMVSLLSTGAFASVITVGSDTTGTGPSEVWQLSTVTTAGGSAGTWSNPGLAPPDDSTFTIDATSTGGSGVTQAAATAFGVDNIGATTGVTYYRTTFELGSFDSVSASLKLAVDNDAAVWINDTLVAYENSFSSANWSAVSPPSLDILADGTITNIVKFDYTAAFTGFVAGTNDLIVAVRNLDGGDTGGLAFRMDVTTAVPEPGTLLLFGMALLTFAGIRLRNLA